MGSNFNTYFIERDGGTIWDANLFWGSMICVPSIVKVDVAEEWLFGSRRLFVRFAEITSMP